MIHLSPETEALARRLAAERNITVEDAIRAALEACAMTTARDAARPRDRSLEAAAARRGRMDEAARAIAALPLLDSRSPREIMDELNAV